MNRHEYSLLLVAVRQKWPTAPEWREATIDAYFRDLEGFGAEDVSEALNAYYRLGRATPPNGGQLVALIDKRQQQARIEAGPPKYEGAPCTCHVRDFWLCEMPAERHGKDWMDRRRGELAAARLVANATPQGRQPRSDEMGGLDCIDVYTAMQSGWYGCLGDAPTAHWREAMAKAQKP